MNETELERLSVKLMGDGTSYQRMIAQAQKSTSTFADQLQFHTGKIAGFGLRLRGFGETALGTAAGYASVLGIGASINAVQGAVSRYMEAEKTEISFEALIGNAELAKKTLGDLRKFAAETPFESPEIMAAAKQMIAFGENAENIVPTMKALGDVSAGLNIPLGQLTYLFGTLKAQGRAMTVDINQFAMRGIPIWKELEKITGKSNAELRKMVEEGKVGFPLVEQAFKNMTKDGGLFAGQLEKQSKSLSGLLSTLRDNVGMVLSDVGKKFVEAFDVKGIVRELGDAAFDVGRWFLFAADKAVELGRSVRTWVLNINKGAVALGAILIALPLIVKVAAAAFGMLGILLNPIVLASVAVVSLGYAFFTMTETGVKSLKWLGDQVDALVEHFKPMREAFSSAVRSGDLELAWKIVIAQMKLEWAQFNVFFTEYWNATKDVFVEEWFDAETSISKGMVDLIGTMKQEHSTFINWYLEQFARIADFLGDAELAESARFVAKMDSSEYAAVQSQAKKLIDEQAAAAKAARQAGRADDLKDAMSNLKKVEEEVAKLQLHARVKEAFRNMFKDAEGQASSLGKEMERPIMKELRITPKFDAAGFNTVEAAARMQEWQDKIGLSTVSKNEVRKPDVPTYDFSGQYTTIDALKNPGVVFDDIRTILKDIRDGRGAQVDSSAGGDF